MLVIYENENYCAINKPENVAVDGPHEVTVEKLVAPRVLKLVHYLDSPTSGVLLLAKTKKAAAAAGAEFQARRTVKFYVAVVRGACYTQVIDAPIEDDLDDSHGFKMRVGGSKSAQTVVFLLEHSTESNCSLVLLRPITGRRHQLRVHLCSVGHPILGDRCYNANDLQSTRLMLHAAFLRNQALPYELWAAPAAEFFRYFTGWDAESVKSRILDELHAASAV